MSTVQPEATAGATCTKPPLKVRFNRRLNRQASAPEGLVGNLLGVIWRREHGRLNDEVLDHLDLRPGLDVLEIGPGPGDALARAAHRSPGGRIVGVDISELMVRQARRRNRQLVASGDLEIRIGDVTSAQVGVATFDRVYSVHCIYFWRDIDAALGNLTIALRPGGRLLLAFRAEGPDIPPRFRDATYRFPRLEDLTTTIEEMGMSIESEPSVTSPGVTLLRASKP